jgi:hypothetical protein
MLATTPKKAKTMKLEATVAERGERMTKGAWRLYNTKNNKIFVGSLIDTINIGNQRIALFSVPKGS